MRRMFALALAAVLTVGLMAGCGTPVEEPSSVEEEPEIIGTAEHLRILLPSGSGEAVVLQYADVFCATLQERLADQGWAVDTVTLEVAASETASGKALDDGTADVIILPANRYFTYMDDTTLLMTATMNGISVDSTVAADWNGSVDPVRYTNEDRPYNRTLICATNSETGKKIAEKARDGVLTAEDLAAAHWMIPKLRDASDFIYPDLWLKDYELTMDALENVLTIDGYGALFAEAGGEQADVVVIAADQRIEYSLAWQLGREEIDYTGKFGLGHEDSIFNDIQVIGVTEPIWGDVMVISDAQEPYCEPGFQKAVIAAMEAMESDSNARAIWKCCGYTGFTPSADSNYDNIRDMAIFGVENE